ARPTRPHAAASLSDRWNALPFIPPPAGVILRAIASGINLGMAADQYAAGSVAFSAGLASQRPSAGGLAATFLVTAAGTVVDAATAKLFVAEERSIQLAWEGEPFALRPAPRPEAPPPAAELPGSPEGIAAPVAQRPLPAPVAT